MRDPRDDERPPRTQMPARDSRHDRDSGPGMAGCLVWLTLLTAALGTLLTLALLASGSN